MLKSVRFLTVMAIASVGTTAAAQGESLQVSFDLAQYSQTGKHCFVRGGVGANRNNWVHTTVVWLEDESNNYVTTLYRWGRTYPYDLEQWAASSNFAVDGMTESTPTSDPNAANGDPGAVFHNFSTPSNPLASDISWLPDGNYKLRLESSYCEIGGEFRSGFIDYDTPHASFDFVKGGTSLNQDLGSQPPFNNVTVDYTVPAGNNPPGTFAGPDLWGMPSVVAADATLRLNGVATDDGGAPAVQWTQVDAQPAGGVAAVFSDATSAVTDVTFGSSGIYTLRLTADDGTLTRSSDVTVYVNAVRMDATHDSEVTTFQPNGNLGILDTSGPWVWAWGCEGVTTDHSKAYYRFDASVLSGNVELAMLRLPFAEGTADPGVRHLFYILDDTQDDWNGGAASTDWEATITWNNQPINNGDINNINAGQLIGSWQHNDCPWRHAFSDPAQAPADAANCPGWVDVDLDVLTIATYDTNNEWSVFMSNDPLTNCNNNGLGLASRENPTDPHIIAVESWQAAPNVAPVADASSTGTAWIDADGNGSHAVTLDGGASTDDVRIIAFEWREGATLIGSSPAPDGVIATLSLGIHTLELTVRDGLGETSTDTVQIVVDDRFSGNVAQGTAATVSGGPPPSGLITDNLFADGASPTGDWFALTLAADGDLTVDVAVAGGDLDLRLLDSIATELDTSAQPGTVDEQVSATALLAGTYYVEVAAAGGAAGAGRYSLTAIVTGTTLGVTLTQPSAAESAGTVDPVGSITLSEVLSTDAVVTLVSSLPELGFVQSPLTIAAGTTSVEFGITLTDNAAVDGDRNATISVTAPGINQGSAVFAILDDEGGVPTAGWEVAAESRPETGTPLIVVRLQLSSRGTATIPFTISGTATEGDDYETFSLPHELTVADDTEAVLLITVNDDADIESDETLILTLGTPTGAIVGGTNTYTLTINDDDTGGTGGNGGTAGSGGTGGGGGDPGGGCHATGSAPPWAFLMFLLLLGLRRKKS